MLKNKILFRYFLMLLFCFVGCQNQDRAVEIDFNDTVEVEDLNKSGKPGINISVGSMITPKEGFGYYKALLDYIASSLGMKVNFIERESYSEVNHLLEKGKIDLAFVCGGPYVDGKERFGLELLAAPQVNGQTVYYSYIIAQKNSDIDRFEDLRGKTFVFVDPMSNSGRFYPVYLLKEIKETPEAFFKEYFYSYAHDSSIRAVAEGIVDAAAVDSLIWNYMQKYDFNFMKDVKIIKISPAYGIPPVVVRPDLKKDLKDKIRQIFLNMHNDKEGKEILDKMLIEKFVQIDDSNYDSIRQMEKYIEPIR